MSNLQPNWCLKIDFQKVCELWHCFKYVEIERFIVRIAIVDHCKYNPNPRRLIIISFRRVTCRIKTYCRTYEYDKRWDCNIVESIYNSKSILEIWYILNPYLIPVFPQIYHKKGERICSGSRLCYWGQTNTNEINKNSSCVPLENYNVYDISYSISKCWSVKIIFFCRLQCPLGYWYLRIARHIILISYHAWLVGFDRLRSRSLQAMF